ncbi:MAG: FtsX-like permease family protein [Spirochaeta sp.]|jgi:lipoprotein-releasing system permease protein|nr:FtsX-like permease family protein [Spirochaeta sp.]
MSLSGVILLARRFLGGTGRGRSRLVTAVVGVALSLIPLIVVQQIADGMISGIVTRFIEAGSYHLQAVARTLPDDESTPALLTQLRDIPGVRSARRERQGFGLIYSDTRRSGVTLRAVPAEFYDGDPAVRDTIEVRAGDFDLNDPDYAVLGAHIAARLDVGPGDEVRVLTVRPLGEGRMLPRVSRFTVSGVVSTGYRDLDQLWVFIPLERGLRIIPEETARDIIGFKVDDPFALPNPLFGRGVSGVLEAESRARMSRASGEIRRHVGSDWFVLDWYSLEQGRYVSFLTSRNLLSVVMAMIVVVAAINVSSALVLLVVEKEQEIAILRATGVDASSIGRTFIVAGLMIGVVGAAIGTAVGLLLAGNINEVLRGVETVISLFAGRSVDLFSSDFYLEEIPVSLRFVPALAAVFFTLVVALMSGLLPARRAARIEPDRILRHSV